MFTKSRQLIRVGSHINSFFIDTPGYLYHYKPYDVDVFIHHKVKPHPHWEDRYYLSWTWVVSDISTGLGLTTPLIARTRTGAVLALHERLSKISLREFNETVWNALINSPPHKAKWRFNTAKSIAEKVEG